MNEAHVKVRADTCSAARTTGYLQLYAGDMSQWHGLWQAGSKSNILHFILPGTERPTTAHVNALLVVPFGLVYHEILRYYQAISTLASHSLLWCGAGRWHGLPALQHISGGASRDGAGSQAADPNQFGQHEWQPGDSALQVHRIDAAGMDMQMLHIQDEWPWQSDCNLIAK